VIAAVFFACAHQREFVPAKGASVEAGHPRVAEATVDGVHLRVGSGVWRSGRVEEVLSLVLAQVDNGSDHPLRIAYSEFTEIRLEALPPFQVAAQNPVVVEPEFAWSGFWLARWQARFYRHGFPVWSGGLVSIRPTTPAGTVPGPPTCRTRTFFAAPCRRG